MDTRSGQVSRNQRRSSTSKENRRLTKGRASWKSEKSKGERRWVEIKINGCQENRTRIPAQYQRNKQASVASINQ